MPYDTHYWFEETTEEHAQRLARPARWTKIRRRALLLKLDGASAGEVMQQMGHTNCPWSLSEATVEELLLGLAVTRAGEQLVPCPGAEPEHSLMPIQEMASTLGLSVTIPDLTRYLAGGSTKQALAQAGVMIGHPPYGYRRDGYQSVTVGGEPRQVPRVVVDDAEKAIVLFLFGRYPAGETFLDIANALNAQGCRTRKGKPWDPETLRDMLRNPTYARYILYRGAAARNDRDAGILYPGLHPAILSWPTFCAAQDVRVHHDPRDPQPRWDCPWNVYAPAGEK